jgi:hypothetical protein
LTRVLAARFIAKPAQRPQAKRQLVPPFLILVLTEVLIRSLGIGFITAFKATPVSDRSAPTQNRTGSGLAAPAPGQPALTATRQLTAGPKAAPRAPKSSPLNLSVFNLVLWELNNDPNTVVHATGNSNAITATDGITQETHSAVGASAFQAAADPALENLLLSGSVYNLDDSGLPFIGTRFTSAFQWDPTIPANSSQTIQFGLNSVPAVPEPSALFLVGLPIAAAMTRRVWRRCKVISAI